VAWSIAKGEFTEEEQPLDAAIREFNEETGITLSGDFIELTPIKQKGGKIVYAWANKSDIEQSTFTCKSKVNIEWPPKSGKIKSFPEVDKFEWFCLEEAKQKINPSQATLIDELIKYIIV
jgi:predicted NUDIX family NTP pyrophosphohydrolase